MALRAARLAAEKEAAARTEVGAAAAAAVAAAAAAVAAAAASGDGADMAADMGVLAAELRAWRELGAAAAVGKAAPSGVVGLPTEELEDDGDGEEWRLDHGSSSSSSSSSSEAAQRGGAGSSSSSRSSAGGGGNDAIVVRPTAFLHAFPVPPPPAGRASLSAHLAQRLPAAQLSAQLGDAARSRVLEMRGASCWRTDRCPSCCCPPPRCSRYRPPCRHRGSRRRGSCSARC